MSTHVAIAVAIGLALWLGVSMLSLARYLRVPPLLFYLMAGLALGPLGLRWLDPKAMGSGLSILVEFGLAFILFEGALNLPFAAGSALPRPSRRVLAVAMPVTIVLSALCAHAFAGLEWLPAAAFGALICVTGPTTMGPLLQSITVTRRLETLLRHESIWGDCFGILLTSAIFPFWFGKATGSLGALPLQILENLSLALGVGLVLGVLLGAVVLPLMRRLADRELPGMVSLGWAALAFVIGQAVSPGSGPIACAVAGFTLRALRPPQLREIRHFKGQVASLFIALFFVLLSALFDGEALGTNPTGLIVTLVALGVFVRPAAMGLALLGTEMPWRERAYAAVVGPRGIIALSVASYAVTQRPGDPQAARLFALTFMVIAASGALATLLARPLAWLLRVRVAEPRTGVVLVGIHDFSKALAAALAPRVAVKLVDSSPDKAAGVKIPGVEVEVANALEEELYEEALEDGFRRLIAMTPNDGLNRAILDRAEPLFGASRVFRVRAREGAGPDAGDPHATRRLAFGNAFRLDALEEGNGWRIVESETSPAGGAALVSLEGGGVMVMRAGAERRGPYLCVLRQQGYGSGEADGEAAPPG